MKTFKYLKCHPKYKHIKTCIDDKLILNMRDIWNKRHPDKIIYSKNIKHIEAQLRKYLSICKDQKCLLNRTLKKKFKLFAPYSPKQWVKGKSDWLDSLDIMRVMKQYEEAYPTFEFIGPSPMDFDSKPDGACVWPELCHFSIKKQLAKKKNKIGFIFNTDPHYEEGSHWVCMFMDLDENYIFYFDSSGAPPTDEINAFIERVLTQCKALNRDMRVYNNKNMKHQYKSGECGMYALYTIITILEHTHNIQYFMKTKIPDIKMNQYRDVVFNAL